MLFHRWVVKFKSSFTFSKAVQRADSGLWALFDSTAVLWMCLLFLTFLQV